VVAGTGRRRRLLYVNPLPHNTRIPPHSTAGSRHPPDRRLPHHLILHRPPLPPQAPRQSPLHPHTVPKAKMAGMVPRRLPLLLQGQIQQPAARQPLRPHPPPPQREPQRAQQRPQRPGLGTRARFRRDDVDDDSNPARPEHHSHHGR